MWNILKTNSERRVVITGLGVISSLGIGWKEFWKNLMAGKSGISRIASFDTSKFDRYSGGEVKNFDPAQFFSKHKISRLGRASQMAIAASKLALEDAKLEPDELKQKKVGVSMGTTGGEIQLLERFHDQRSCDVSSIYNNFIPFFPSNSISANIALEFDFATQNSVLATACASGNYALGQAFDLIKRKNVDYVIAGGADAFSRIYFMGFQTLSAVAPEKCQPFDKNRQGMIPGEGAGVLVLETLESAQKRGAYIYAEILGYGLSCDASDMAEPDPEGIVTAIQKSLQNSRVNIDQIDYISAHGTGTVENDLAECQAYHAVFGKRTKGIPISSIKSMLGHTMGAASAFETIACCLAIKDSLVPPTINLEEQDCKCDIDCVPHQGRSHEVRMALNNSQAFGGNNACLILCLWEK